MLAVHTPSYLPVRALRTAVSLIAADNGFPFRDDADMGEILARAMHAMQEKFTPMELRAIGEELDSLSEVELVEVCMGEQGKVTVHPDTSAALNLAFESL